jgi:hypothetical protein
MLGFETSRCFEMLTCPTLAHPTPQTSKPNKRIFIIAAPTVAKQRPCQNSFEISSLKLIRKCPHGRGSGAWSRRVGVSGDDFVEIGQAILLGLQQIPTKTEQALIVTDDPQVAYKQHGTRISGAAVVVVRLASRGVSPRLLKRNQLETDKLDA